MIQLYIVDTMPESTSVSTRRLYNLQSLHGRDSTERAWLQLCQHVEVYVPDMKHEEKLEKAMQKGEYVTLLYKMSNSNIFQYTEYFVLFVCFFSFKQNNGH